ncbi:MAG TPA: SagB/ThcOx family dehydrogenase [Vicinamibacterales bacterium]|nr:SagB/ThcOx family dehydrogenase [Vicinamibacterales bacterium]
MRRYHDGTKHHFQRFARSLGYLDWASQPKPFRTFAGAASFPLYPAPGAPAGTYAPHAVTFDQACRSGVAAEPLSAAALGDLLRHALGLSAWKQFNASRWSLRVNPSSGNLHPTEAYVLAPALAGLADAPAVYHYAADRHALELRGRFDDDAWAHAVGGRRDIVFIALTSIHWREAWKYGERAFRYCQHDLGHAAAAVSIAAGMFGWRATLLPAWSHADIAAVTGVDRDQDFVEAEREEPGCVIAVSATPWECGRASVQALVDAAARGRWTGRASQLSEDHVTWSFIDEVARATEDEGRSIAAAAPPPTHRVQDDRRIDARALVLQRRSALAFDGRSTIDRGSFIAMLSRTLPGETATWTVPWWTPRVHLAVFVHRVDGVGPGLYMFVRDADALDRLRAACRPDFAWERADDRLPLWLLVPADVRALSARLSCDQDIASDGFFSLGMLAEFDTSLETFGPSFYRHLFWETGMVGQLLYLEAEAAGARGTGIGCFYDDPVHTVLGLEGHAFQSLYHFTVGRPVDDPRLSTEPGYAWERPRTP